MGRGKQRQPAADGESWAARHFVLIILGAFMLVGIILLVVAGLMASNARAVLDRERSARGRVVDVEQRYDSENDPYLLFVIEFLLPNEELQRSALYGSSNPPAYAIGDSVDIRYDPLFPEAVRLDVPGSAATEWVGPVLLGLLGAGFTAAPLLALFAIRPRSWRDL